MENEKVIIKVKPDYILAFIVFAILGIGLIMVFSAQPSMALKTGDALYYFKRHLLHIFFGIAALIIGLRLDYFKLKGWSNILLLGTIILLILVFIPGIGKTIAGASRWIDLQIFSFQPSELAKIILPIFLANFISANKLDLKNFLKLVLIVGIISALILGQPDLGTAITIALTSFLILYIGGAEGHHLLISLLIAAGTLAGLTLSSPYRLARIVSFINPWQDPLRGGFQTIQSLLAVGSGGILGLGLGGSRQKFFYLPQQFTDFIYAILCEELGLLGGAGVIVLFVLFAIRGLRIGRLAPDTFGVLLATGIVSSIIIQAIINFGVVLGVLPTTGVPLPLISFGGTSLITTLYSIGLLLNISKYRGEPRYNIGAKGTP